MQVETRRVTNWNEAIGKVLDIAAARERPQAPWKKLELKAARSATGFDKPAYLPHVTPELLGDTEYFGKPYSFNTKYVVDVTADDVIGSIITLASGDKVHVDMVESVVTQQCNRR